MLKKWSRTVNALLKKYTIRALTVPAVTDRSSRVSALGATKSFL
jgi:hypothetical protein